MRLAAICALVTVGMLLAVALETYRHFRELDRIEARECQARGLIWIERRCVMPPRGML